MDGYPIGCLDTEQTTVISHRSTACCLWKKLIANIP